jgi:diguanylate cyclase (GGDEF)-like protein
MLFNMMLIFCCIGYNREPMANWLMAASIHSTDIQPYYIGKPWPYRVAPNDKLLSGDLVYLFAGQSGVYGWGYITKIEQYQDDVQKGMMKVTVSRPVVQEGIVSLALIYQDKQLSDIIRRLDGNFVELTPKETNAFNKLLRSQGAEGPPDIPEIQDRIGKFGIRDDYSFDPKLALAIEQYNLASVLFGDLDKFKPVDDTCGHDVGDQVIKDALDVAQSVIQDRGELFHPHGDEMLVLLPNLNDRDARELAERIRVAIEKHQFPVIGQGFVTTTIGVATYPDTCKQWEDLKKSADLTAMQAKKVKRNWVVNCLDVLNIPLPISDGELADAQLELRRLDALSEDRPGHEKAKTKRQKMIILEGLIKRLQNEGRPAMAWTLQRQVEGIMNDGRVATSSQRKLHKILDIEAERNALREEENRSKRGR